ncbi:hypothetical protein FOL47_008681 [Perkinsus chesapeaki]|uniref:RZ-type domain-containing protein n=1 Tax=Perkinsus chesapeaki TaxID=330153 RepID=A0A7J6MTA0_PERCH|nr:hypothetical protein FOL47_008681 [Perkinsus chesapeaki]
MFGVASETIESLLSKLRAPEQDRPEELSITPTSSVAVPEAKAYSALMAADRLLPSMSEIAGDDKPPPLISKLVNRQTDSWDSSNEDELLLYRATHYHCLREDLVIPLKEVLRYSLGYMTKSGVPPRGLCHQRVQMLPRPFKAIDGTGVCVKMSFDCPRPVDFGVGSNLRHGSLVVLYLTSTGTPKGQYIRDSLVYAVVVDVMPSQKTGRSSSGEVCLDLSQLDFSKLCYDKQYCMLESPDYYLAKKPVFDFLIDGELLSNTLLLPRLLGNIAGHEAGPPAFLAGVELDLGCLYTGVDEPAEIRGDPLEPWPTVEGRAVELDPAQQVAMHHIFSTPLAMVQGPPGTGKSYLGVKFVRLARVALDAKGHSEPILAITLTNHALDQLLQDLLPHMKGRLMRFGGRSKSGNEELQACNIRENMKETPEEYAGRQKSAKSIKFIGRSMNAVTALCQDRGVRLCILAYLPFSILRKVLSPRGWQTSFAYLGSSIMDFAILALDRWLEGAEDELYATEECWLSSHQTRVSSSSLRSTRRTPRPYDSIDEGSKNGLLVEMLAGVDSSLEEIFGYKPSVNVSPLSSTFSAVEDSTSLGDVPVIRPTDDDVSKTAMDLPLYTNERTMASAFQQYLRVAIESMVGADCVAVACHALVNSLAKRNDSPRTRWQIWSPVRAALRRFVPVRVARLQQEGNEVAATQAQRRKSVQLRACLGGALVGMTSTFAALNRDLVHRLAPRVVIIEEAGELLECQLMACLSSSKLEHVVLIGDHQQLRPKINAFELCRKNHFDISLLERLINFNVPFAKLSIQLRMRPEVSQLVKHFYADGLIDHERVKKYDRVGGVATDVYFLDHRELEQSFEGTSKKNDYEARFATSLALYLVRSQQYQPEDITLLTPYIGQKRLMRDYLNPSIKSDKSSNRCGVHVATIDDYQGEENKVIILSLVRSNLECRPGFVGIENRVIVALSRAREGLFILGNTKVLDNSKSWVGPLRVLRDQGRVGPALTLTCRVHPDHIERVAGPEGFKYVKDGGCRYPCGTLLPACGHVCPYLCHVFDHDGVQCRKACARPRPDGCNHKCIHMCSECSNKDSKPEDVCKTPCSILVPVDLSCGHKNYVRCFLKDDLGERRCLVKVSCELPCGHTVILPCHEAQCDVGSVKCNFESIVHAACGHEVKQICNTPRKCTRDCEMKLPCGHRCSKKCLPQHGHVTTDCEWPCDAYLLCGHKCDMRCGQPHTKLCNEPCPIKCLHGHGCPRKCYEICTPCKESCPRQCEHHKCSKFCHEMCERPLCDQPCKIKLRCGHPCQGLCGEPCPPCPTCEPTLQCAITLDEISSSLEDNAKLYRLPECGHTFFVEGLDKYMSTRVTNNDHTAVRLLCCPTCKQATYTAPRYGNSAKSQIALLSEVKKKLLKTFGPLNREERQQVDVAMSAEITGSTVGHWYACPNGHPYFIGDCGAARQSAVCRECGARVGGQDTLASENRAIFEFVEGGD